MIGAFPRLLAEARLEQRAMQAQREIVERPGQSVLRRLRKL